MGQVTGSTGTEISLLKGFNRFLTPVYYNLVVYCIGNLTLLLVALHTERILLVPDGKERFLAGRPMGNMTGSANHFTTCSPYYRLTVVPVLWHVYCQAGGQIQWMCKAG